MHLIEAEAWCTDCDWTTEARNAMGNAAQHHQKTGHYVQMQLIYGQTFGKPNQPYLKDNPTADGHPDMRRPE